MFFNVLPCMYLINDEEFKSNMLENKYYLTLLKIFNCERNAGSITVDKNQDENVSAKINSLEEEKK